MLWLQGMAFQKTSKNGKALIAAMKQQQEQLQQKSSARPRA